MRQNLKVIILRKSAALIYKKNRDLIYLYKLLCDIRLIQFFLYKQAGKSWFQSDQIYSVLKFILKHVYLPKNKIILNYRLV